MKRRFLFTGGVSHGQVYPGSWKPSGNAGTNSPDAQSAGAIGAAVIGQRQKTRHERVSVLFHSTVGVIQTRKALGSGMTFASAIFRDFTRRLRVMHLADCPPGEEIQWVIPWATGSFVSRMVALHCTLRDFLRVRIIKDRYVYFSISH